MVLNQDGSKNVQLLQSNRVPIATLGRLEYGVLNIKAAPTSLNFLTVSGLHILLPHPGFSPKIHPRFKFKVDPRNLEAILPKIEEFLSENYYSKLKLNLAEDTMRSNRNSEFAPIPKIEDNLKIHEERKNEVEISIDLNEL